MSLELAADLIVFFHLLYVLFTVGGEILVLFGGAIGWQWVRNRVFRIIHLLASFFVAVEALIGAMCPLTTIEYILRRRAGQTVDNEISFVGRLIRSIIFYDFPAVFFTLLYVGFASLVIITFFLIKPKKRSKKSSNA
ncbi:MAG: DUF2784 domain-containing protein [Spirochaetales bacterium]|nr:DUF2784 domain-containing protein [Spirochaetales bacterium]